MRAKREPKFGILKRARIWLRSQRTRRRFSEALARGAGEARAGRHEFVIVADHLRPWRNAGAILRTADAFGARAMYVVGTEFFDPKAAMGALKHVPLRFFRDFAEAHAALVSEGYTVYVLVPPLDGEPARHLHETELPAKTAFVVGNETSGLSFTPEAFQGVLRLGIEQYGKMPCLNASVAAGLAMYEYATQHADPRGSARHPGDPEGGR